MTSYRYALSTADGGSLILEVSPEAITISAIHSDGEPFALTLEVSALEANIFAKALADGAHIFTHLQPPPDEGNVLSFARLFQPRRADVDAEPEAEPEAEPQHGGQYL